MTPNTTPTMPLRSILENDKLNGTNFLDWYRNLRIVLRQERKEYILDQPIPEEPAALMLLEHKRILITSILMIQLMSLVSCLDAWSLSFKSN